MDVVSPQLLWIGTRCYRVNSKCEDEYEPSIDNCECIEGNQYDDASEPEYDIKEIENEKYQTSFHVPSSFFAIIIGAKGQTRHRLEVETKAQIQVPRQGIDGNVIVTATSRKSVVSCRQRIEMIVLAAREKQQFTHFLSIPLTSLSIKHNFLKFKEYVLAERPVSSNLHESFFQKPEKLHLTLCTLSLMDNQDRALAAELLQEFQESVLRPIIDDSKTQEIHVRGLEYMNDDPNSVDVLYAKVESDSLQLIADQLYEHFCTSKLVKKKSNCVKLHATLINSLFASPYDGTDSKVNASRLTFDASFILSKFSKFDFGSLKFTEIHLSQRFSVSCDGYYEATGVLKF